MQNSMNSPIDVNIEYNFTNVDSDAELKKLCRQIIRSSIYAAEGSRSDLCESASLSLLVGIKMKQTIFY